MCGTWLIHTEWRRCIGCLKLQDSFRQRAANLSFCQRAANYRAFLRKMTNQKTWIIHMSDVICVTCKALTPSYVWRGTHSFIHATCGISFSFIYVTHSYMWHDLFISVTWLIHTCDMTHSYVWHDSFIYITWLIHICDMTHSYMWHDSFISVTRLIHICDMTHS